MLNQKLILPTQTELKSQDFLCLYYFYILCITFRYHRARQQTLVLPYLHVRANDEPTDWFAYGASNGDANVRILHGELDFGPGSLLVS